MQIKSKLSQLVTLLHLLSSRRLLPSPHTHPIPLHNPHTMELTVSKVNFKESTVQSFGNDMVLGLFFAEI